MDEWNQMNEDNVVSQLTDQKDFDSLVQIREFLIGNQVHEINKNIESLKLALEKESAERKKTVSEALSRQVTQIRSERLQIAELLRTLADELTKGIDSTD